MPFTAEARPLAGGEWVKVSALNKTPEEMAELRNTHALRCPDPHCAAQLRTRIPQAARPHFFHMPNEGTDDCLLRGGESQVHLESKAAVAQWAKQQKSYSGCTVDLEHILDNGHVRRVADVLVRMPNGEMHVIECQVSYQTAAEFEERTRDYYELGAADVLWFLDKSRVSVGPVADWVARQWVIGYLNITSEVVTIG